MKRHLQHEAPALVVYKVSRGVTLEIIDAKCMQAGRQRHAAGLVYEYMASYAGPRHNQSAMQIMVLQHAVAVGMVLAQIPVVLSSMTSWSTLSRRAAATHRRWR